MDENVPSNFESATPATPAPPPATPLPPVSPPPPVAPPPRIAPPPPAPRKSRGWMIVALLAIGLLGVSVLFNIGHVLHGVVAGIGMKGKSGHADPFEEHVVKDNDSENKFVEIDVQGVITSQLGEGGRNMVTLFKEQLDKAAEDESVKAIILKVDSPGGEVLAADDMAKALVDFHKKSSKPIIVSMEGLAASGGYYISAPCQWIVANELTITGSIGVIMESYNYRGLMDKIGVSPMVFKSGKFKDMLSGEKSAAEILPEERQMVQALIDETFSKFKQVVAEGRGKAESDNKAKKAEDKNRALADDWRGYADGRILSGKQAYDLGFVDELGDLDVAFERAKKIVGLEQANLVRYQQPFDVFSLLHLFGKTETPALKIDLGVDRPKLQVGRLYFMSSSVFY